ncbi:MAG: exodeoxyribonuclease V subunit alpha [Myxococcota bacterium]|nr:exodeoxyribonuclease V subunit alpha [Myxococcota bacterium]
MSTPLQPRGTLRSRFVPSPYADIFRRIGAGARTCDLGDEGLYLAEELVAADRWLGEQDAQALAILVLALMIAQRQGSTRLPLDPSAKGPLRTLVGDINRVAKLDLDTARVIKTITELTKTGRFMHVIGHRDARLPLVVDDDALYTERTRWLEQRVALRLAERIATPRADASKIVEDLVRRPAQRALSDEQAAAVKLALSGKLTVVTGGPGTGKTVVAAAIVRGFARMGIEHVALAAQTGKAANRLTQVIGEQLAALTKSTTEPAPADARLAVSPPSAQTLHRLLGYRGGRFSHHAQSPLPVGAVIVDEASMIDLELVDALLDALPASAPLVLIGDAHQLPAIDAGQLLADLAGAEAIEVRTQRQPDLFQAAAVRAADEAATVVRGGGEDPITSRVAVLAKSFRMDTSDVNGRAVYEAAQAIHEGTAHRLTDKSNPLATPRTPGTLQFQGVEWVETSTSPRAQDVTLAAATSLWHHFEGPRALRFAEHVFQFVDGRVDQAQYAELEQLWFLLNRARILTVTRALPTGSIAINDHVHELALDRLSVTGRPDFVPGEPVMITANDYQRGLFNGDQGIIVRADEGLGRHHYRAIFRVAGELRPFAIEALRDRLELAWALTVHKSQGSELDAVALLLPHDDLPLVTRELLYTGITRARTGVAICGAKSILAAGAKRRALRHSGLAVRLRATLAGR